MEVKEFIEQNKLNMISDLARLVQYDSKMNDDGGPFGKENQKVLDEALKIFEESGLKPHNVDYYAGYGEIGEGDKVIGILGHLDIVPAGDGWKTDPFKLYEEDGILYGRGVSDDKGPVISSLYAIKYLLNEGYKFKKRLRLIVGCNEENGSECIKYYVSKEGHIDLGFTPDGGFPGIFAEKGLLGAILEGKTNIISISGGTASNVVCKEVNAEVEKGSVDISKMETYFKGHEVGYKFEEKDNLHITVLGKAAHGSNPDGGVNAINHLFMALHEGGFKDEFTDFFVEKIGLNNHLDSVNASELNDEYTNLTMNLGVIYKEDDMVKMTVDIRFPVTRSGKEAVAVLKRLECDAAKIEMERVTEPLFFDQSHPMIEALLGAYKKVTGDIEAKMIAIGGGTYAKAIHNCVAFGAGFMKHDSHAHDANENLHMDDWFKQVEIYVEAIKNLNEVEL